ncbi:MAG: GntR family transcriptional regulator [bacterium]|nr:GntR family transcriptional regulator [bacterium]
MYIRLDPHSGEPLSKQLKERLQYLIVSGVVAPGAQIDSVRALAEKTGVNPTTVAKVFTQLQMEGYLPSRRPTPPARKNAACARRSARRSWKRASWAWMPTILLP